MKKFKAILSVGIALCIGVSSLTTAFAADEITFTYEKIGDFDSNKIVDVSDVTTLQMQLASFDIMDVGALNTADFNGDGDFDVTDVTEMQKMIAGLDYVCYAETDDSYLNIQSSYMRALPILSSEKEIEFEKVLFTNEIVPVIYEYKYQYTNDFLISSKEEFTHLFNATSTNFDETFFDEYSLYVWTTRCPSPNISDNRKVTAMGIEDNKLLVDKAIHYPNFPGYENLEISEWSYIYKVKKSDINNLDSIFIYTVVSADP